MHTLIKCQNAAQKKGGLLLSDKITRRKLQWKCNNGHQFSLTAYKVINRGEWCRQCGASNGERAIRNFLTKIGAPFIQQYKLQNSRRKYDFYFQYNNTNYIVEYDGEQHFKYTRRYHRTKANFYKSQKIDRVKTHCALKAGYKIIRIDYTNINNIPQLLTDALNNRYYQYYSCPNLYKYILEKQVTPEEVNEYF